MSYPVPKVEKVMIQPINVIFGYLQNRTRISIWIYESPNKEFEGVIIGFDEFMNLVLEEVEEINTTTNSRSKLGRILLKGTHMASSFNMEKTSEQMRKLNEKLQQDENKFGSYK